MSSHFNFVTAHRWTFFWEGEIIIPYSQLSMPLYYTFPKSS